MKRYSKVTKCTVQRSNHRGEVYSNDTSPIGAGAQGRSIQIRPNTEVCLEKTFLPCFTDAVIETTQRQRNPKTGVDEIEAVKIPRFIVNYKGFYLCTKECMLTGKCNGIPITHDEFFDDSTDDEEGMKKLAKERKGQQELLKEIDTTAEDIKI